MNPIFRLSALFCWVACLGLADAACAAIAQAPRPNFIFVLIDDMGYADLSCYGQTQVETPHLDRLAREGIRFTQFYVNAPICSPSRTAFTTGQYPARWRITSFLASRAENDRRGMAQWLDPKAPTLARTLQQAGYATGHFGKWHMGGQRDVGEAPLITEYGFDQSLTQFEGLGERILPLGDAFDGQPPRRHALGSDQLGRGPIQWMDRSQITGAFVARALEFIRQAEQAGKPFYVNVWPDDVHSPFYPPKALRGDGSKRELYLGVVKAMDRQLAPLFDYVRQQPALRTNTVVLVASDNGPEPGAGSAGSFRGHKGTLYEGGIREPFIVWSPGLVEESARGTVNAATVVSAVDVFPSVARLAGLALPAGIAFDGEDLSRVLLGKSSGPRSKPLFWNRPPDRRGGNGAILPDLAARQGNWKLLLARDGTDPQLYDLAEDPGETRNLAAARPAVVRNLSRPLLAWWRSLPGARVAPAQARAQGRVFANPIAEGADPWMIQHGTNYVTCLSEANRGIALYCSDRLTALGAKHVIWQAPDEGPCSREVWAPEIHFLDARWHVYFAASDGQNRNHRMWALRSESPDLFGKYTLHGPLYTGDHPETGADNRWAIDGTILEQDGKRCFLWSGWEDARDQQWLYIAPMSDPLAVAGKRVRLCANDDYLWERVGETAAGRGLHEAPQVLQRNGRTFVIYSCSASWQPSYKLGLLALRPGGNPLAPSDWTKHPQPVFQPNDTTFGVGHLSFVKSPDGTEDWMLYHAKMDRRDGWRRAIHAQPFRWTTGGLPDFGSPLPTSSQLPLPAGERTVAATAPWRSALGCEADLACFNYFGHHQFCQLKEGQLHLGIVPAEPVNDFRAGEKLVLANRYWRDLACSVRLKVLDGGRDAGLLFRCSLPAVGYDSQEGYFAGIIPNARKVVLGSTDGESWRELGLADADVQSGRDHLLSVTARGPEIVLSLDGKEVMRRTDSEHRGGSVGLRVVDTHAAFSDLTIQ
ncbi:MAG TPA: sulfatase-like hydrolase/transferase [Candidatus Paceibacterota bacterium]|nr:sulfatase-like hydrolase/transferase [Candidatus Paceibacterota bacterium]